MKDWQRIGTSAGLSASDQNIIRAAAQADPAFAKKIGKMLSAFYDYTVEGFDVLPAANVQAGTDLFLDVYGDVYDINAGWPDAWAILILAAVVDGSGRLTSLKTSEYMTSSVHGYPAPYQNHIKIGFPGPFHWHAVLGPMPNYAVNWKVELFACHADNVGYDWSLWV